MKKRFLKVSFFCLLMACMPATFTSCKDYDDDIAVLTEQTGSLQSQVNSLEEALNANKEAAAQAAQAAADAMSAAKAAQATADEALAAAKAAQATGDEALALAKSNEAAVAAAQADALYAQALAEEAKQAAATAKAEAIAEVMEQVKALMEEQRALTEKELAEIAGQIEGIEKGLNELSGALEGVNGELDRVENELTDKINVVADELATLEQAVEVQRAAFEEFQTLVNGKIETLESNYATLQETVEGIEDTIAEITQDVSDLQAADQAMQNGIDLMKADIVKIALDVENLQISVKANADAIATINERLDVIDGLLAALDKKIDDVKDQAFGYTDAEVAELRTDLMGVITTIEATLNGKIDLINKNITSIQGDITNIQGDITNMQDEITVVKGDIKDINGKITNIQGDITVIRGDITGIQGDIANINEDITTIKGDVNSIKDQLSQMNDEITAIHGDIDRLSGYIEDINGKIDEINKQLETINERLDGIDGQINNINGALGEHSILISNLGDKLNNTINTLVTVFADRLTSVTLMPDAYADGIPCIDFSTAQFKEMKGEGDNWKYVDVKDAKAIRLTPNSIPVSYRLSPKSVSPFSIEDVSFVEKTASILTRGGDDCILKVEGYTVENGVLVVRAAKNGDAAINKTADGKINIAALRVKQKSTKLGNETLKGAEVHSEYARVTEGVFTPSLAEIEMPTNHLAIAPANAEFIAEVPYDETLNLYDYVSVCKTTADSHDIMTAEELAAYDFTVEFALADYNKTVWSQIENGVITPGFVREDGTFSAHDKKASKKEQVYRATLKYGEKVIDVKFVKVYFQPSKAEELTINLQGYTSAISCNPVDDYSFTLTWRQFTDVFNNENIRLLNPKEFHGVYTAGDIKVVYKFNGKDITEGVPAVADVTLDAERQYAMSFTFNENVPSEYMPLNVDEVTTLDIEVICTPNYLKEDTYPVLTIATSLTIEPLRPYLATAAYQNETFWEGAKFEAQPAPYAVKDQFTTLEVLPLQYGSIDPRDGSVVGKNGKTCDYYFPIKQAFMLSNTESDQTQPSIVRHHARIAKCSSWDMLFAADGVYNGTYESYNLVQPNGYIGSQSTVFTKPNAYVLKDMNENKAAVALRWDAGHEVFGETNVISTPVYIEVINNEVTNPGNNAGKILVHQEKTTKLTLMAQYPNGQQIPVRTYDLKFIKPLNFSQISMGDSFTDGIMGGSKISTYDAFEIKDFRGYAVKKTNVLYNYYGISDVTWHVDEARIGLKYTGAVSSLEEVTLPAENGMLTFNPATTMALSDVPNTKIAVTYDQATGELIYNNFGGVAVANKFYLVVPVSITHKWAPEPIKTMVVIPVVDGKIEQYKRAK